MGRSTQTPSGELNMEVSKNTLKQRRRREKLKLEGGKKLHAELEKDRLRKQEERASVRKKAKTDPKLLERVREKNKLEMQRYRAKKKSEKANKTPKAAAAKKQDSKKSKQNASQKNIDTLEKKVAKLHAKNWRLRVQLSDFEPAQDQQPSTSNFSSAQL